MTNKLEELEKEMKEAKADADAAALAAYKAFEAAKRAYNNELNKNNDKIRGVFWGVFITMISVWLFIKLN
jgi:hypothetical protein